VIKLFALLLIIVSAMVSMAQNCNMALVAVFNCREAQTALASYVQSGDKRHAKQIAIALERYRTLHYDPSQRIIIVNIPEARLYAIDKGGTLALTMRVDVGQPDYRDTRTPVFTSEINSFVVRPYWTVPMSIQREEIVDYIRDDPDYVPWGHYDVITPEGKLVTNNKVTSEQLRQLATGKLRIRQRPGPDNSLGLIKFNVPNKYSVFLHDTPDWENFFSKPKRDVTHGCVHLEYPALLASWLSGWPVERVKKAMRSGRNEVYVAIKPVTVAIIYATASVRSGEIKFYPDIYGLDSIENMSATKWLK
jgi:murein L,D-transpeptidase YcbB/YkuD